MDISKACVCHLLCDPFQKDPVVSAVSQSIAAQIGETTELFLHV